MVITMLAPSRSILPRRASPTCAPLLIVAPRHCVLPSALDRCRYLCYKCSCQRERSIEPIRTLFDPS